MTLYAATSCSSLGRHNIYGLQVNKSLAAVSHVFAVAIGYIHHQWLLFILFTHTSFCNSCGTKYIYKYNTRCISVDRVLWDPWPVGRGGARSVCGIQRESKWDSSAPNLAAVWPPELRAHLSVLRHPCYLHTLTQSAIATVNKCIRCISSLYLHIARLEEKILCNDDPKM